MKKINTIEAMKYYVFLTLFYIFSVRNAILMTLNIFSCASLVLSVQIFCSVLRSF